MPISNDETEGGALLEQLYKGDTVVIAAYLERALGKLGWPAEVAWGAVVEPGLTPLVVSTPSGVLQVELTSETPDSEMEKPAAARRAYSKLAVSPDDERASRLLAQMKREIETGGISDDAALRSRLTAAAMDYAGKQMSGEIPMRPI